MPEKKNKRILLWMPCGSGNVPTETMSCLLHLRDNLPDGYELDFEFQTRQLVERARNKIMQKAYTEKYDYLFFLDDDNPVPAQTLQRMIEDKKDVVTWIIPWRYKTDKGRYVLCIMEEKKDDYGLTYYENKTSIPDTDEPFMVDNHGTWCVLISQPVIKFMRERYSGIPFKFKTTTWEVDPDKKEIIKEMDIDKGPFGWKDIHMAYYSEDLMFFHRAKHEWGFELWCDPRVKWYHISDTTKVEVDDSFYEREVTTSIVMPVYNTLAFTKQALHEIQKKLTTKYEIIVIDDGSTDWTKEYLDWVKDYLNLTVITHETNMWVNYSWNEWMALAKGKYIMVINNDILMSEWCDQELIYCMDRNNLLVCGPITMENEALTKGWTYTAQNIIGWCFMVRRDARVQIGNIPETLYMWYWDDWIFRRTKELKKHYAMWISIKAKVYHYGSQTLDHWFADKWFKNKRLRDDAVERKKICKEHNREDERNKDE